jgi:hypothetical protein
MHLCTSSGCAWRALYLYTGTRANPGFKVARISLDPTFRVSCARFSGSAAGRRDCTGHHCATWNFALMLPRSRHWYLFDGRRTR